MVIRAASPGSCNFTLPREPLGAFSEDSWGKALEQGEHGRMLSESRCPGVEGKVSISQACGTMDWLERVGPQEACKKIGHDIIPRDKGVCSSCVALLAPLVLGALGSCGSLAFTHVSSIIMWTPYAMD